MVNHKILLTLLSVSHCPPTTVLFEMKVRLSTSSSEKITHVLCVGLSYFFSLLACFPSHKPLLVLSAETVNSLLQQLSWPELLSSSHSWHQGAVGLVYS